LDAFFGHASGSAFRERGRPWSSIGVPTRSLSALLRIKIRKVSDVANDTGLSRERTELRDGTKGLQSRDELQALIAKRVVECEGQYFDRYDRVVAICRVDGRDLGEGMLAIGWATAWPKYLEGTPVKDAYLDAERKARDAGFGLWAE
jgi:hypothetical protein